MRIGLDTFKHVLPTGRAWSITVGKQLREVFVGLADEPSDVQDYQDAVWDDYLPQSTTKLDEWDDQWGFLSTAAGEQARRDRIDAAWKALGGQSPKYLQDTVRAAGFDVYIHEWWHEGTSPPIARQPGNYISVDGTGTAVVTQLGKPGAQLGGPKALLGIKRNLGLLLTNNLTPPVTIPSDPTKWPYFLYWGGPSFPDFATVPAEREAEFKTLLLKLCPAQQWIGILVEFT